MPSLPQEIIEEILYRLPAKTIGRCRCVSKAWLALLTQPYFIKTHLKQTQKHPTQSSSHLLLSNSAAMFSVPLSIAHQLLDESPCWPTKIDTPVIPNKWYFGIASCDGLVLVLDDESKMWLINPTTLAIREVPPSPFAQAPRVLTVSIFGLGYDECRDDYKVVSLSFDALQFTKMFVSVFSVKNGAWRTVENSPYDHLIKPCTCVFADGSIHWLANEITDKDAYIIMAFRLRDEKLYGVPVPSSVVGDQFPCDWLRLLGGCLCMGLSEGDEETDVWVMKEYGVLESWTKFTVVEPEGVKLTPLCLLGEGRVLMIKDEGTSDEKLATYNVKEGTMKEIVVNGITSYLV